MVVDFFFVTKKNSYGQNTLIGQYLFISQQAFFAMVRKIVEEKKMNILCRGCMPHIASIKRYTYIKKMEI